MKPETIARIRRFSAERDWDQFHTPANLAKSISIEANELLECFQWSDTDYDLAHVGEELADVMVYCQNMLDALGLDADAIINAKMDQNEAKYPVEKCRGMKDPIFLAQKSAPATVMDLPVAQDLRDTLIAHRDGCVGMAANMIGVAKRIIIFDDNGSATVMFNPEIVKCSGAYEAEEGCLSLTGTRKAKRYRSIKVQYQNEQFQTRVKTYTGFTAQIIQHEIDQRPLLLQIMKKLEDWSQA